ncbi:MAG: UDP-N-acetylmuramoyl-L-alanyl-D-glutamate--2,6-diaminopimelate ligase [Bacillota bacterium]
MKLSDLIRTAEVIDVYGNTDIEISGIAYDSRKVDKGYVFVCLEGSQVDGHDFASSAVGKGAAALVVNKEINVEGDITIIRVNDTRKALSAIAADYYGRPSQKMNMIGITGTNGKTTTTYLIKEILEINGGNSGLIGTISYKILDKEYKAVNTTPESLELQRLFAEMLEKSVDTCVMEVSSHSLEVGRVADVHFSIGVFTNLTRDHMDFHGDIESYKKAKTKLFYKTTQANIINIDDPYGVEIAQVIEGLPVKLLTYGMNKGADITAKDVSISLKGARFTLVTPAYRGPVEIATPGRFSVYNALAAASVCYILGYDLKQIQDGLRSIKGVPGRFELVGNTGDHCIIVDYAHTPDALENVLNTTKEFVKGKLITVFGCGGDRDKTKRPMMGEIAGKLSDYCVITSDNPRTENPGVIMEEIENGIKKTDCKYKMIVDRRMAIHEAIASSTPGDVIVIAGKGHETYQIIGSNVIDFDDRLIAQEILRGE